MKLSNIFLLLAGLITTPGFASPVNIEWQLNTGVKYDDTLTVAELDQVSQQSDTALTLSGQAKLTWEINPKLNFKSSLSHQLSDYKTYDHYDLSMNKITLALDYALPSSTIGTSFYFVEAKLDKLSFLQLSQHSIYWSKLYQQQYLFRLSTNFNNKKFNDLHERNADSISLNNQHFYFFNQANNFISLSLTAEQEKANSKEFSHVNLGVNTLISHRFNAWQHHQKVQLGWQYHHKKYQRLAFTPRRKEQQHITDITWQINYNAHWAVKSNLAYGKYKSTLASLTYNETVAEIAIEGKY